MSAPWGAASFVFVIILAASVAFVIASNPPAVSLVSPPANNVSTSNTTVFNCTSTDDENVYSIDLYHNIGGTFGLNSTKRVMELDVDANTTVLCHFNNTYVCETPDTGENSSTDFVQSKFIDGVRVNSSDTLRYPTFGNLNLTVGSIEFWVKPGFNATTDNVWLFSTGITEINEIHIFTELGSLKAILYDQDGSTSDLSVNISGWATNDWKHVALTWNYLSALENGYYSDLFVNGSDQGTSISESFSNEGNLATYMYLGSKISSFQSNSVFDEFRVSNNSRTRSQVNSSYLRGAANHSVESLNLTVGNIPDGTYFWSCLSRDNESQVTWATSNLSFSVDRASPPTVNFITLIPNDTDTVDPGVRINVTANLTDPSNVSSAIFQYKYDLDWVNVTMNNISGGTTMWNASFTTIGQERTYYLRIVSNDSRNNLGTSANQSINSTLDYTWSRTPATADAYGLIGTIANVVLLTLNNTGDDTITFTLSDNWPITDVYYNTTNQFTVPSGSARAVNVTANFASQDSVSNMTITVSASVTAPGEVPSPSSSTVLVTMNSFSGGPYIVADITSYPVSVTQGQSGAVLNSTIKNIGNETAQNVWLNWTVPSGWTNTSGPTSIFVGNLSSQTTNSSNLAMSISSSLATSGIVNVCVNGTSTSSTNSSECVAVQVDCSSSDGVCGLACTFNNDVDCPSVTVSAGGGSSGGGGGGSGGSSSVVVKTEEVELDDVMRSPDKVHVTKGLTSSFLVSVSNLFRNRSLSGASLGMEGDISQYLSVSPAVIGDLAAGGSTAIYVSSAVPNFYKTGSYDLIVFLVDSSGEVVDSDSVTILVSSINSSTAMGIVAAAAGDIADISALGIPVKKALRILESANRSVSNGVYDEAQRASDEIRKIRDDMLEARSIIDEVRSAMGQDSSITGAFIGSSGKFAETENLLNLAEAAMEREDHVLAAQRAKDAKAALIIEGGTFDPAFLLLRYWWVFLSSVVCGSVAFVFGRREYVKASIRREMSDLHREEANIVRTMGELQLRYFKHRSVGESTFTKNIADHRKRLSKVRQRIADLRHTRSRILGASKLLNDLESERKYIAKSVSDLQKNYFMKSDVSRGLYKDQMEAYEERMAEIDDEQSVLKAREGKQK